MTTDDTIPVDVPPASETGPDWYRSPQWWPMWSLPLGALLAFATASYAAAVPVPAGFQSRTGTAFVGFIAFAVGLTLYAGLLNLISVRWFAGLRRYLAGITAAVATVSVVLFYGAIFSVLLDHPNARPLVDPLIAAGVGPIVALAWGVILLALVVILGLIAGIRSGAPRVAEIHRPD